MSKLNKIFQSIPVPIPERSGFDLSHESIGTATTGTVVPVTHFEVLPGDKISMGSMMSVTLPPFAVPFKGRIDAELTAAFIPYRLLWKGWQSFITQNNGVSPSYNRGYTPYAVPRLVDFTGNSAGYPFSPSNNITVANEIAMYGPGTLADYLGVKAGAGRAGATIYPGTPNGISALPFLAYHKFCDDWIRDENNILPFFDKTFNGYAVLNDGGGSPDNIGSPTSDSRLYMATGRLCPFLTQEHVTAPSLFASSASNPASFSKLLLQPANTLGASGFPSDTYPNGPSVDLTLGLGSLRQRCWAKDYFTTATTRPQAGAESQVTFAVTGTNDSSTNAVTGSGAFTIASLRAANALQKWLERNNIAGTDYGSQILAHFGVTPPDAVMDRSVLLGSVRTPVVVNSVENNSNAEMSAGSTKNPFGTALGSAAGFGSANESGRLVDDFEPKEHGIIMVFFSLIPHAYYNSGVDRQLMHVEFGDFAWPEFASIGDQAIYASELSSAGGSNIFGYNQRYSEYKFKLDRISGLIADNQSLDVYALQRGFSGATPALGKSFLEIPVNYLDQVFAVTTANSGFSCIFDCYFDCSALRVLPEYSLPKL